jgi:hypothetical protein
MVTNLVCHLTPARKTRGFIKRVQAIARGVISYSLDLTRQSPDKSIPSLE